MVIVKKVFLGVDWGTHSSKWAADIITDKGSITKSNLISSDLLYRDGEITIDPTDDYYPNVERIISLKRRIILDPHGPFWEFNRKDIGMPLGMGVLFSICSILGDFLNFINNEMSLNSLANTEIGFSFPNWLKDKDLESKVAVNHYYQAINLACCLFQTFKKDLPVPHKPYSVIGWRELVGNTIKNFSFADDNEIKISDMTIKSYPLSEFCNGNSQNEFKWRYLVESCAAGLPYLRNIKLQTPPGLPGLGKLLVVDVGAGSTDVGYMLRTISLKGEENLFYFTPAQTLRVAGNELTEKIRDYHHSAGKHITFSEAEAFKITKTEEWVNNPFVSNWCDTISEHIRQYVKVVPDKRWLNVDVPLQIIITGGSGLVKGLADKVKDGVSEGLKQRGLAHITANNVILIEEVLSNWEFRIKEDYARTAVAIGCSDSDKPSLKYLAKMDTLITHKPTYTPILKYKK